MDRELIVNCSPVYLNEGKHHVIVHIARARDNMTGYDRCDVVLPEGNIVGYYGFKDNESDGLFAYIKAHEKSIWELGYDMSEAYFSDQEQQTCVAE